MSPTSESHLRRKVGLVNGFGNCKDEILQEGENEAVGFINKVITCTLTEIFLYDKGRNDIEMCRYEIM